MPASEEMTVEEAAERAGVSRQAIHKAIGAGKLDARSTTSQANSPKVINRASFDKWNKERRQPTTG